MAPTIAETAIRVVRVARCLPDCSGDAVVAAGVLRAKSRHLSRVSQCHRMMTSVGDILATPEGVRRGQIRRRGAENRIEKRRSGVDPPSDLFVRCSLSLAMNPAVGARLHQPRSRPGI
jgi:hypothetical protein